MLQSVLCFTTDGRAPSESAGNPNGKKATRRTVVCCPMHAVRPTRDSVRRQCAPNTKASAAAAACSAVQCGAIHARSVAGGVSHQAMGGRWGACLLVAPRTNRSAFVLRPSSSASSWETTLQRATQSTQRCAAGACGCNTTQWHGSTYNTTRQATCTAIRHTTGQRVGTTY